jgi:hypothetical protein
MDISPFFIDFLYHDRWENAKIRPCCREDNVVDYAVWIKGKLVFTITRSATGENGGAWVVALKNADVNVDNELVQRIGKEIDIKKAELEQASRR